MKSVLLALKRAGARFCLFSDGCRCCDCPAGIGVPALHLKHATVACEKNVLEPSAVIPAYSGIHFANLQTVYVYEKTKSAKIATRQINIDS